ncbi:hypothetical protein [Pseudomonas phage Bertil]|uniref:Uncharacterized protein n=1 Tax=Pseudomonas phage Bertil TaxID=2801385 RepID=A0A7T8EQD4_9CAUD|nr:hypothetical protein [Pseudomonas phage Bertil]QQO90876.1 hypothetical protein [Pseudomonas phage Strit]
MQTFKLSLAVAMTVVVPKEFLAEARKEAQAEDASLFLKTMQDKYPEDDDQFMLAVVKNAFRSNIRRDQLNFMMRSGIGGAVSPVQIISEEIHAGKGAVAEFANATDPDKVVAEVEPKAEQVRIDKTSPGVLVQGLVHKRAERAE